MARRVFKTKKDNIAGAILLLHKCPSFVSYDDWSDVFHIIEFEDTTSPPTRFTDKDGSDNGGGCGFFFWVTLVAIVILCLFYFKF